MDWKRLNTEKQGRASVHPQQCWHACVHVHGAARVSHRIGGSRCTSRPSLQGCAAIWLALQVEKLEQAMAERSALEREMVKRSLMESTQLQLEELRTRLDNVSAHAHKDEHAHACIHAFMHALTQSEESHRRILSQRDERIAELSSGNTRMHATIYRAHTWTCGPWSLRQSCLRCGAELSKRQRHGHNRRKV